MATLHAVAFILCSRKKLLAVTQLTVGLETSAEELPIVTRRRIHESPSERECEDDFKKQTCKRLKASFARLNQIGSASEIWSSLDPRRPTEIVSKTGYSSPSHSVAVSRQLCGVISSAITSSRVAENCCCVSSLTKGFPCDGTTMASWWMCCLC